MSDGQVRARTVRFSPRLDDQVKHHARLEGISVSQFIREAVLLRLFWMYLDKHPGLPGEFEQALRDIRDGTI